MKKYGLSIAFMVLHFMGQVLGGDFEHLHPYSKLLLHTKALLEKCSREQGENVENDCFDMETLCVTSEDRDRKFTGHGDYKFPKPFQAPYKTLKENLEKYDLVGSLDRIQGLDDEDKFLRIETTFRKDMPLKDYKRDLTERVNIAQRRLGLSDDPFSEGKQKAMIAFIEILAELNEFSFEGCRAHKIFPEQDLKVLALGKPF